MSRVPVCGTVPGAVILHHVSVSLLLQAAVQHLQDQTEAPVHGMEVGLDEDGGEAVTEQRLLHQGAQQVLLLGQQLQTQVGRPPYPGDRHSHEVEEEHNVN